MTQWSEDDFNSIVLKDPISYTVILGKPLAGKTFIAKLLEKYLEFKLLDVKVIEEIARKKLGTDDEPFDGTPPIASIENEIIAIFEKDKQSGKKFHYVFDGYTHPSAESFAQFCYRIGLPSNIIEAYV
jgi:hypothetical protein